MTISKQETDLIGKTANYHDRGGLTCKVLIIGPLQEVYGRVEIQIQGIQGTQGTRFVTLDKLKIIRE